MKRGLLIVSLVVLGFWSRSVSGVVITVPGDFGTIQGAIDAAGVSGDEIVVSPGTYPEVINFNGKAIYLHSLSGDPADTIIDGTGLNDSVVLCISGEGAGTVLEGFTITGGTGTMSVLGVFTRGGGMFNFDSNPTVTNCTFSGNSADLGGGMLNYVSSPTVSGCIFSGNTATSRNISNGGGMYNFIFSDPTVTNCIFSGNTASLRGGGMYNFDSNNPTVTNCTFSGNSASHGGGMSNSSSNPTVTNCILWGDSPDEIKNITSTFGPSQPTFSFCNVQGDLGAGSIDGGGNIDVNPLFLDTDGLDNILGSPDDNLRLLSGSPCIDTGDTLALPLDVFDFDGDGDTQEPIPFDLGGLFRVVGTAVDMGAYEFQSEEDDDDHEDEDDGEDDEDEEDGDDDDDDDDHFIVQGVQFRSLDHIILRNPRNLHSHRSALACPMDLNGDGRVGIEDLELVLGASAESRQYRKPALIGVVNSSGSVNIDDLVAVINAFGGCP